MSALDTPVRWRFWFESALASLTGVLGVVTLLWHDWLEAFGWDPDHGNGSVEWAIVAGLLVACLTSTMVARTEWRRAVTAPASR
jgi:hypothetical protein